MTEFDHILAVHRAEVERTEAALQCIVIALFLIGYGVYRLIGWVS